jgi:uncharacterized protein (UPF0332 family)
MTINAEDFYEFANEIMDIGKRNRKEIYYRNVASRAYYYSYHQCANLLVRKYGFQIPRENVHQAVYHELIHRDFDLAQLLNRMRTLRTRADYQLESTLTDRDATQALLFAQEVADRVKAL